VITSSSRGHYGAPADASDLPEPAQVLYGDNMSALVYGVLFSGVGGMMVYISLVELLPTALKYDPEDSVVSTCTLAGMGAMAASLLMFAA
jgi:ZIP family zinc transporter